MLVSQGELFGYIVETDENGDWTPRVVHEQTFGPWRQAVPMAPRVDCDCGWRNPMRGLTDGSFEIAAIDHARSHL